MSGADLMSLSISQLDNRAQARHPEISKRWLAPPRFRASVELEWEGEPPEEILALIARAEDKR